MSGGGGGGSIEGGRLIEGDVSKKTDSASNRVIAAITLMLQTIT